MTDLPELLNSINAVAAQALRSGLNIGKAERERLKRERDELVEALDQMTAWACHIEAEGGRALTLAGHIKTAKSLLARYRKEEESRV